MTACEEILQHSVDEVDNPALSASTSSPDYFRTLVEPTLTIIALLENSFLEYSEKGEKKTEVLVMNSIRAASTISEYVVNGKTTSNSSRDIEFGESKSKLRVLFFFFISH